MLAKPTLGFKEYGLDDHGVRANDRPKASDSHRVVGSVLDGVQVDICTILESEGYQQRIKCALSLVSDGRT